MFAEQIYPVLSRGRVPFAGGVEVQLAHIGRGLVRLGYEVTAVTCDYGQPDGLEVDGIRLLKCYPRQSGLPVLRFFHPRLTGGIAALRRANADVYLFQGAALWAGIVRDLAAAMGRRFVWLVAHDHDVMADLPDVSGLRDRTWVKRAIFGADRIVSQTELQRGLLLQNFGRDSVVIPNAVVLPCEERLADPGQTPVISWLATYKPGKRPEWFTRFAERHADIQCRMAGVVPAPPLDDRAWHDARAAAARLRNLEVQPTIPHERVGEFLRQSTLFAHTSPAEGFPNAFLEAWAHGLPSVTCFDPDGTIARERLGACCSDYESWERELERRVASAELRRAEGARARAYVTGHHAPEIIDSRMAVLIDGVLGRTPEPVS
jgi:glycosyltransferase involved in cell wall biosynthesis